MRQKLLELKKTSSKEISTLINVIIGEFDRLGKNLSEDDSIKIIHKMMKNTSQTIGLLTISLKDPDEVKVEKLTKEIELLKSEVNFLKSLLPSTLSEDEIRKIIITMKLLNNNTNLSDVMKHFKENFSGKYDGKQVSTMAKELLN